MPYPARLPIPEAAELIVFVAKSIGIERRRRHAVLGRIAYGRPGQTDVLQVVLKPVFPAAALFAAVKNSSFT